MDDGGAADGTRITRIVLPDGTPIWARISGAEELERPVAPSGLSYSDIGFAEQVQARVESLQGVVTGVARSLAAPLRAVRPDEVSVEFGIELTAKAGKVVGLLADGEAKGAIKVTLTWNGAPPADPPPQPPAPPLPAQVAAPPAPTAPPPGASAGAATHPDAAARPDGHGS
ncbi:CU044_2847 family protein [Streptomyces sp. NPDC059176]|uniref:CU044_2847 family protein n=1 Tax=unclassified Streptomyces TaxID=2593676 RepID=UPI0036A6DAF3